MEGHLLCLQEAYFCGLAPGPTLHRVAVEVVTTMTSADVMWQDGSVECNIRSNDLFPVHHLDNNEFCPGDFVVDKRGSAAFWGEVGCIGLGVQRVPVWLKCACRQAPQSSSVSHGPPDFPSPELPRPCCLWCGAVWGSCWPYLHGEVVQAATKWG